MLTSKEVKQLAAEIFNADQNIVHQGIIDLEGHVLLDQSSSANCLTSLDANIV